MTEWLHFHFSLSCIGEGNGNPLQCSCLENPRDGRAWGAAVYGVAQSRTWLKWLSSSSSSHRGLDACLNTASISPSPGNRLQFSSGTYPPQPPWVQAVGGADLITWLWGRLGTRSRQSETSPLTTRIGSYKWETQNRETWATSRPSDTTSGRKGPSFYWTARLVVIRLCGSSLLWMKSKGVEPRDRKISENAIWATGSSCAWSPSILGFLITQTYKVPFCLRQIGFFTYNQEIPNDGALRSESRLYPEGTTLRDI